MLKVNGGHRARLALNSCPCDSYFCVLLAALVTAYACRIIQRRLPANDPILVELSLSRHLSCIGNKKTLLSQGNRAMPQLFFSV